MKLARLVVLGVALAAGGGAVFFLNGAKPPPPAIVQAAPTIEMEDVLVAAKEVPLGTLVSDQDIQWVSWPRASTSNGMVLKSVTPGGFDDAKGSVTRAPFVQGEPIRKEKLVKGPNSGFMSAILPSGSRAVAIEIDGGGKSSAGGFILPNDHVDIVRTFRDEEASKASGLDMYSAQTILSNIRVLAIGQNVQEKNGERVVVGTNATLELEPAQVEVVMLAQRIGQLSLSLRSMVDSNQKIPAEQALPQDRSGVTVVRYGVAASVTKR